MADSIKGSVVGWLSSTAFAFCVAGCGGGSEQAPKAEKVILSPSPSSAETEQTVGQSSQNHKEIVLYPGDDIAEIVDEAGDGAIFRLAAGIYANVTFSPRNGQTFIGENGVVFDGSTPITDWSQDGSLWTSRSFPSPKYSHGPGRDGLAQYREDLFIDGVPYLRVASRAAVTRGTFYQEQQQVWISVNPIGRATFASNTGVAVEGGTSADVTFRNIDFVYYASMAQHGAIEAQHTTGWTLENVNALYNHGGGLAAGSAMKVIGGSYSYNGQIGIHGQDLDDLSITGVIVNANNYAGFDNGWDAGGIKVLTSDGVSISMSCVHGNSGTGIWLDTDVLGSSITGNAVFDNQLPGIVVEASRQGLLSRNRSLKNNRGGEKEGYWSSEILVQNSSNIEVTDNVVVSQTGEGIGLVYDTRPLGRFGRHDTRNNTVIPRRAEADSLRGIPKLVIF